MDTRASGLSDSAHLSLPASFVTTLTAVALYAVGLVTLQSAPLCVAVGVSLTLLGPVVRRVGMPSSSAFVTAVFGLALVAMGAMALVA